jgi:hypothetical protein
VPNDAHFGEIRGTITAVGRKTAPITAHESMKGDDTHVVYCVATKGTIYVNVIKQDNLKLTWLERT